jgi:hypothetical protein
MTRRNILRQVNVNDWHAGQDIHLLSALAAMLQLGQSQSGFSNALAWATARAQSVPP